MLKSPVTSVDEFAFFNDTVHKMASLRPEDIVLIFKDLKEKEKKQLKDML
jgi:hypothetical protein